MKNKKLANNIVKGDRVATEIFACMDKLASISKSSNRLLTQGYVNVILGTVLQSLSFVRTEKSYSSDSITYILEYLEVHYQEDLSLDSISKHFGYSKFHFSRMFNYYFGCGIMEYLNLIRISKTIAVIINTQCTIQDALTANGFQSFQTFYRAFKKHYNMSPTEYIDSLARAQNSKDQPIKAAKTFCC